MIRVLELIPPLGSMALLDSEVVFLSVHTSRVKKQGYKEFLEFPLSLMDNSLMLPGFEPSTFDDAINNALSLIDQIKEVHGLVVLNWHPHVFNEDLYPKWKDAYIEILNNLSDGWVSNLRDHTNYWLKRRNYSVNTLTQDNYS